MKQYVKFQKKNVYKHPISRFFRMFQVCHLKYANNLSQEYFHFFFFFKKQNLYNKRPFSFLIVIITILIPKNYIM